MLTAVATFSVAAALLVVLPGPDTLVVLRSMVRGGRRRAVLTALGGLTGLTVWVTTAALGLAALLRASEGAYLTVKIAGAAYLIWLGVKSLRSRALGTAAETPEVGPREPVAQPPSGRRGRSLQGYGAGLATNLLNPKIGVLFVALMPGFVPAGHSVAATSLLLGGIYIALTAVYVTVLIALSGSVMRWMSDPRIRRRADRAMGVVFLAFGLQVATEH
jgi:threonine/homoserine/homoserine lactone efflux protein